MKNTPRIVWIVPVCAWIFGCQQIEGECWPVSEDGQGQGAGGGPLLPGAGGFGDVPPEPQDTTERAYVDCDVQEQPDKGKEGGSCGDSPAIAEGETYAHCTGPCAAKCPTAGVHGFSSSVFKFTVVVPDDGKDEAGGWQAATAKLSFVRLTSFFPEDWSCTVTVGMPIRAAAYGTISPSSAATMAADIASQAGSTLMHVKPELPKGIFCTKLAPTMQALFPVKYPKLGATVK